MISVGIDVAKDKHDCCIMNSEGVILADVFTIPNNMDGFTALLDKLRACSTPQDSIKVGLEAAGHYSDNILGFLLDNGPAVTGHALFPVSAPTILRGPAELLPHQIHRQKTICLRACGEALKTK